MLATKQVGSQVLGSRGGKYIFRGQDFCSYCIFKTIFAGHNKIWGGTKI